MNFSFRLENSCTRFKDSFAESLTRLGRSIFNSLILSCFLTTGDLRNKLVTPRLLPIVSHCKALDKESRAAEQGQTVNHRFRGPRTGGDAARPRGASPCLSQPPLAYADCRRCPDHLHRPN